MMAATGRAADASPWDNGLKSRVRLIAATAPRAAGEPILRAGIEIALDTGWKTYWRYPGDSGVPPRFDFARSENVKSVTVRWPAPHGFTDEGGRSIGYKGGTILPLAIVPKDRAAPVVLRLDVEYAVCEKLCVPAEAKAELALTGGGTNHDAALAAAEARVPVAIGIGADGPLAIRAVRREPGAKLPRILVDVAAPPGTTPELFAEGPTPDWALPVPQQVAGAPEGQVRFAFDLDGAPPGGAADGAMLVLTAVTGDRAIEARTRLD